MTAHDALFTILSEKLKQNALVLPSLPAIAIKVQEAAQDPEVNIDDMVKVIMQDAVLSGRIIHVANSVAFARAVKVETLAQAVRRIGLRKIRDIALAMAIEQLFNSNNDIVANYMNKCWQQTVEVTSAALVIISQYLKENKIKSLSVDSMMLSGLMHQIGVLPILVEAQNHPNVFANPTFLTPAIDRLSGQIGALVMASWGFEKAFTMQTVNWQLDEQEGISYSDFIQLGAVYAQCLPQELSEQDIISHAVDNQLIDSAAALSEPEFIEQVEAFKSIFA